MTFDSQLPQRLPPLSPLQLVAHLEAAIEVAGDPAFHARTALIVTFAVGVR